MKPFLKWAGNKYAIMAHIQAILDTLPPGSRLIEPFAGSGAVFLNTHYAHNVLADANADLIHLYQALQAEGEDFIGACQQWFTPEHNTAEQYYELRQRFNTTEDVRLKSALFLYLNRHCFNGLCRYNSRNGFNVPFGRYKKPYFPQKELEAFCQKARHAEFRHADFETVMQEARAGDVVYCDPPYIPLSATASFTHYSQAGFSLAQQNRLGVLAAELAVRGVTVLVSNHDTPFTREVYHSARLTQLSVQRYISCNGKTRGKVPELLALFVPPVRAGQKIGCNRLSR